jgi:hypothetical protein
MPSCTVLISPLLNHMNVWFKHKWLLYIIKCTVSGEEVKVVDAAGSLNLGCWYITADFATDAFQKGENQYYSENSKID